MRFSAIASVLLFGLSANANPAAEAANELLAPVEARGVDPVTPNNPLLAKRECIYNGCRCDSRGRQLTVCGNCVWTDTGSYAVTKLRKDNHIYECSPSGDCCDYGVGNDCGSGGAQCKIN
ncbi:hypothetical protein jhhlp_000644 [Lomentospora prolificans]|uniref:Uncharacterized protein n=1 Tax=Lomentospora prolificans TaxID=41688 RepID=A0A2N3NJ43_9PEZI|nr:hypothetical protein jhhlp_000644 [Lomentospora prolificans]